MPSYRRCPVTADLHDSIKETHPDWRWCAFCRSELKHPSIAQEDTKTVIKSISPERPATTIRDLPDSSNGNPTLAYTSSALAAAMTPSFPIKTERLGTSNQFAHAVRTADQGQLRNIQSPSISFEPVTCMVALDLYLGEYRPIYIADIEIAKWKRLELYERFSARSIIFNQRYESHTSMIRSVLEQFDVDSSLYNQEWELVHSVTKANGGSICHYGVNLAQITSLQSLFERTSGPTHKVPFVMVLLARELLPPSSDDEDWMDNRRRRRRIA